MESKFVSKKFLSSYTPCLFNAGTEATFFHDETHLLKFIKKEFLKDDRELITRKLEELSHPSLTIPQFLLHDRSGFLGYGMNYYKEYKTLDSLITNSMFYPNENLPFDKRKDIALKICQLFDYINTTDYSFYDIHGKNILINDDLDLKLIDLDSGAFKGTTNDKITYQISYLHASRQLALFVLAFLYNMDYSEFEMIFNHPFSYIKANLNELYDYLPDRLKEFYNFALNRNFYIFNGIGECVDRIDETTYDDTLQILQKRL